MQNFILTIIALVIIVFTWQIALGIVLVWVAYHVLRVVFLAMWDGFLRELLLGKDPNK